MEKLGKRIINFLINTKDDAHEFKPLLTEIEESPINPLGQTIFWLVISFFCNKICHTIWIIKNFIRFNIHIFG